MIAEAARRGGSDTRPADLVGVGAATREDEFRELLDVIFEMASKREIAIAPLEESSYAR